MNDRTRQIERLAKALTQTGRADAFRADDRVAFEDERFHAAAGSFARRDAARGAAPDDQQLDVTHRAQVF
jgi:hypothetical protein